MSKNDKDEDRQGMLIGGIIVLGIGLTFLLSNMGVLPSISELWPMFMVVVGIALVIGSFMKKKDKSDEQKAD